MTVKEYIKAIDMRRSRRSYRPKPLSKEITEVIKQMVDAVNEECVPRPRHLLGIGNI